MRRLFFFWRFRRPDYNGLAQQLNVRWLFMKNKTKLSAADDVNSFRCFFFLFLFRFSFPPKSRRCTAHHNVTSSFQLRRYCGNAIIHFVSRSHSFSKHAVHTKNNTNKTNIIWIICQCAVLRDDGYLSFGNHMGLWLLYCSNGKLETYFKIMSPRCTRKASDIRTLWRMRIVEHIVFG